MLRISIFLATLILIQGTLSIQYKGYTYGMQGDDVLLNENGKPVPPPKIAAWITWTESMDSSWARAEVIYDGKCDSMEFVRLPKSSGWFLKSFNNRNPKRPKYRGNAHQNSDSIKIGIGVGNSGISFYGIRDTFVLASPSGQ
jgi:hypothetical protein